MNEKATAKIICVKCNKELVMKNRNLVYLGNLVNYDFPTCPECGNIYISPEIVNGKMRELETAFENK